MLVSVGRKPNSDIPGLENTQVHVNSRGFIEVNKQLQTSDPSIYAIGDVVGEPMLAHKASHEGRTAVEAIAGTQGRLRAQCDTRCRLYRSGGRLVRTHRNSGGKRKERNQSCEVSLGRIGTGCHTGSAGRNDKADR